MKKKKMGKQLSRSRKARRALFRSLVRAMVSRGAIITTITKAKVIQPEIERLTSMARKGDLSARRRVYARLGNDRKTTDELFGNIAKVFSETKSGFTRIVHLPQRRGDNARMARLEWVKNIHLSKKDSGKKKKDPAGEKKEKKINKRTVKK